MVMLAIIVARESFDFLALVAAGVNLLWRVQRLIHSNVVSPKRSSATTTTKPYPLIHHNVRSKTMLLSK